jgi:hypothetical protein
MTLMTANDYLRTASPYMQILWLYCLAEEWVCGHYDPFAISMPCWMRRRDLL